MPHSFFKKRLRTPKSNKMPLIAIMARRPHSRNCVIRLPGRELCMIFCTFFIFSAGSLDGVALRLLWGDLVAKVILRGWLWVSERAVCPFFVFSSGSLMLEPALGSFTACEDLEAKVALCKPTGFGGFAGFANFFVCSSGSLAFARSTAALANVAMSRARLSPPRNPPPLPPPPLPSPQPRPF